MHHSMLCMIVIRPVMREHMDFYGNRLVIEEALCLASRTVSRRIKKGESRNKLAPDGIQQ